MLNHISLSVSSLELSGAFYDAVLGALGYARVWSYDNAIGYGRDGEGDKFAIKLSATEVVPPGPGFHIAFSGPTTAKVDEFYSAALVHGGRDNGAPGLRPQYGPTYYAAFVLDPDGYRLEAKHDNPSS